MLRRIRFANSPSTACLLEPLESRELLSGGHGKGNGNGNGNGNGPNLGNALAHVPATSALLKKMQAQSIEFSAAPTTVQTGLTILAAAQSLPAPTPDLLVYLGNVDGVQIYSIFLDSAGTTTKLTVDLAGNVYTAPVRSSTTFGAIGNAAVTNEITAIAAALHLKAPTDATKVHVVTPSTGPAVYTITLKGTSWQYPTTTFSVDADGFPVGNAKIPFGVLPLAIQSGLNANTPAGATPLTETDLVAVRTSFGFTTYSATFKSQGVKTTVTVDRAGFLATLPSSSTSTFSAIPSLAQDGLQTLATAHGVVGTISLSQSVFVLDQGNGTTLYTVRLMGITTNPAGKTHKWPMVFTVDQLGNPTVAISVKDLFEGCY